MTNFDLWEQFKFSFICYSYKYENNYFQACVIKSFNWLLICLYRSSFL